MTVRIAVSITANASSLVTLHAGTSCEQGVNGQLTQQTQDNFRKPTSWRHFREMPTNEMVRRLIHLRKQVDRSGSF
jgi:hypothetical protein